MSPRRRRLRRASQVIIHLLSGRDENFWKKELENQHRAVLCLDMELDPRQNLLRDDIMEFLIELADSGRAVAWLGGPPCRTMSRLRYRQPGPPPLRSREGAERFGLHWLDESLKKRVIGDTILWLRQYYLYHRAKKVSQQKVLYLSEQPEDPENYLEEEMIKKQRYPSYWAFPEWKWMKETNDFIEVHFDQGRTGHIKRKPTTLGTNIYELQHLQGLRGPGSSREGGADELTVEQRIQLSRTWAAWSPGLKNAIVTAVKNELDGRIKRLTLEQWKAHLLNDHQPYYRGCRTCLEACGQSRHHRRIVTPDSYTLAIDLAGPFKKGEDQLGHGRYMLVGSFTVPVSMDGRALHLKTEEEDSAHRCGNPRVEGGRTASAASGAEDDDHPGGEGRPIPAPGPIEGGIFNDPEDPEEVQQHEAGDDPLLEEDDQMASLTKDEKKDDTEEWKRKIEEEQNFEVKQITLVEILPDRSGPAVISGLSRMHARLRYLGLPLLRLHSDRAGELRSKTIRKWAEDRKIYRTYTDGDSYKSNGRAEGDINMIKKQVRTLLKETGFEASLWPLAARHAAERRMRLQLEALQCPTRPLLQFGREAYAMQKIWNEKYQDWKMTLRKVTIMGPDVAMSASMPGYYVRGEDGKYFHSSDVVTAEGPPTEAQLEEAELGLLQDHGVRRRITGKTTMLSTLRADENSQVTVSEIEQRRLRGLQLLMEELDIQDTDLDQSAESSTEDEKAGSDRFIRALLADVEGLADKLIEVEQDYQHQETVDIELAAENQEVFLQTRMFSLAEVKANLAEWIPSMKSELDSLMIETGAIKEITWKESDRLRREAESKGVLFEKIPAKAVFSRKAGSGKRKCRACACGNYMAQRDQLDTYAGGTGATEVRTVLRKAGLEGWSAVALDVKTAFLRAPRDHSREIVVVQPPAIFVLAGLCGPDTLWLVEKALYGLTTSPKEWTQFRNQSLGDFRRLHLRGSEDQRPGHLEDCGGQPIPSGALRHHWGCPSAALPESQGMGSRICDDWWQDRWSFRHICGRHPGRWWEGGASRILHQNEGGVGGRSTRLGDPGWPIGEILGHGDWAQGPEVPDPSKGLHPELAREIPPWEAGIIGFNPSAWAGGSHWPQGCADCSTSDWWTALGSWSHTTRHQLRCQPDVPVFNQKPQRGSEDWKGSEELPQILFGIGTGIWKAHRGRLRRGEHSATIQTWKPGRSLHWCQLCFQWTSKHEWCGWIFRWCSGVLDHLPAELYDLVHGRKWADVTARRPDCTSMPPIDCGDDPGGEGGRTNVQWQYGGN